MNITFSDDSTKQYVKGITGSEIINNFSNKRKKNIVLIKYNDELLDLSDKIFNDGRIEFIEKNDDAVLPIVRHNLSYILGCAVKELYCDAILGTGSDAENGFYYDFKTDKYISSDDFNKIENKMKEIIDSALFTKHEYSKQEIIIKINNNEKYILEIINSSPNDTVTACKINNFIDLCDKSYIFLKNNFKFFKLLKTSSVYWKNDCNNDSLQRIYGTAWLSKKQLDEYIYSIEQAEKRDHRKIGQQLELFHFQNEARGMVFWHPKGWTIYKILQSYIRNKLIKNEYVEVNTPILMDNVLWKISGHWYKYYNNMFISNIDDDVYALKPMNCPSHVQIFKQYVKSYRDLPYRMAEFGCCHRNEPSGSLHGLLRVRNFVQDDAHIFCQESQIGSETVKFCKLLLDTYRDFGFEKVKVRFSDRPENRVGDDIMWNKSEKALLDALHDTGLEYVLNPGDGAFYGPKLEFVLTDALGREWQCGTLQVDFYLPRQFEIEYVDKNDKKCTPVMLHRAIIGTFERFIGILIEEYSGKFPIWLAPVQIGIVGVSNEFDDHLLNLKNTLINNNIRVEIDISKNKINSKIKTFFDKKVPIIGVIGKNEIDNNNINIRIGNSSGNIMTVNQIIDMINKENNKYLK